MKAKAGKRKRFWYWGPAAGIAIALLLMLVVKTGSLEKSRHLLPDGSAIHFQGVTFAKSHSYPPDTLWGKFQKVLPRPMARFLGLPGGGGTISMGQESLGLWFTVEPSGSRVPNDRILFSLFDSNGVESFQDTGMLSSQLGDDRYMICRVTTAWPRRNQEIGVRMYYATSNRPPERITEFKVVNKWQTNAPHWKPQAIPCTFSAGDLEVTLEEFFYSKNPFAETNAQTLLPDSRFPVAKLSVLREGKAVSTWQVTRVHITDATGNASWMPHTSTHQDGKELFVFRKLWSSDIMSPISFWSGEKAWKLGLTFSPRPQAQWSTNELYTVDRVLLPNRSEVLPVRSSHTVNGVTFSIEAIHGADHPPEAAEGSFHGRTVIMLGNYHFNESIVLLSATTAEGEELNVEPPKNAILTRSTPGGGTSSGTVSAFPIEEAPEETTVTLTFGVTTNRSASILIPPPKLH